MTLETILAGYSSTALAELAKAHAPGGRAAPTKPANVALLAAALRDTDRCGALRLTPSERALLAIACAASRRTKATLLLAARARGVPDAPGAFLSLTRLGLLLSVPELGHAKLELVTFRDAPDVPIIVAPAILAAPPPLPLLVTFDLPIVNPARVIPLHTGGWADTAARLTSLLGAVGRRRPRLKKNGELAQTALDGLVKESRLTLRWVEWLLELGGSGGLLLSDGETLQPARDLHPDLSFEELLRRVWTGYLPRSMWEDDLDVEQPAERSALAWGHEDVARDTRSVLFGALARLGTDGWVMLDAVVDHLIAMDPSLGVLSQREQGFHHVLPVILTASRRLQQREYLRGAIVQAARRLGFVDVGSLSGAPFVPTRLDRQPYLYDEQHTDGELAGGTRRTRAKDARPWAPTPCDVVVRLTPLGRAVLAGAPARTDAAGAAAADVHVGMDFEVLAPVASTPPGLALLLDRALLAVPWGAGDPVRRWTFERAAWLDALQAGVDGEALLRRLEERSGRPLPENVRATVRGWGGGFGATTLYEGHDLVGFASRAERDAQLDGPGRVAVGETWLLVPMGALAGPVTDYERAAPRTLTLHADGRVEARVGTDLRLEAGLLVYTEREGDGFRLSTERLRGCAVEEVLTFFRERSLTPPPAAVEVAVRGWCGALPLARYGALEVVRLPDADAVRALAERSDVRPHLLGTLGGELFVVRPGAMEALRAVLERLGVATEAGIDLGTPVPAGTKRASR